jgi:uncharacterized protein YbaP (TraB family)
MHSGSFFSNQKLRLSVLLFVLIFSFPFQIFSQNKGKYPALLWEISGNGLSKPSYLYGTMHVSNKLAFHLSDSFFLALKSADIIALETNPQDWLQNMKEMGMFDMGNEYGGFMSYFNYGGGGDFYKTAFKFEVPDNKEIGMVLASDPDLVNGLLYRSNDLQGNHEENTYLDLFIFQTAKKLDKKVTNLEDFKESEKMVQQAMIPDPDEEESAQKFYKGMYEERGNIQEKIEDAYRKGDLDALDSLSRLTYPSKKYEKYMLHLRNEVMVRGMDSIMKKEVLFTGVGAAHLPGEKGVIELLRKKGYKVRPVTFKVSKQSIKEKEKIEKTVKPLTYATRFAPDSSFKVDAPGRLIETTKYGETRYYLCPEMINGAYFLVSRIKTFSGLYGQDQEYLMKRLDSLFYENIPGKIIKNTRITANNGWPGYEIMNQTRRGDFQRYKIFAGPQEIFVFKMGGTGAFAKGSDGEKFFNSISFPETKKQGWQRFSPPTGGFSAELPATVLYEKPANKKNSGPAEKLQAYDPATGDFYIAMRAYYNDFAYIEEDTFELNLFLNRFVAKKNLEILEKKQAEKGKYPMLSSKLKNKTTGELLYVNFYLKGPHYFMLAAKTKNNSYPEKYFNSFRFEDFKFTGKFKDNYDSTMYFTVNDEFDDVDDNLLSNMMNQGLFNNYLNKKEKKKFDDAYQGTFLEKNFFSPSSNEAIKVEYRKFNDYRMEKQKEEFWKNELEYLTKSNGLIIKEKKVSENNGAVQYDLLLTDTASSRGIKTRILLKNGVEYTLQSSIDTLGGMSYWMQNFYNSFRPKDSVIGKNIFEDKMNVFLSDLASKDSSKKNAAVNSGGEVIFKKEHLPELIKFMSSKEFTALELNIRTWMVGRLAEIKDDKVIAFLQKQYVTYSDTASMQFAILSGLAAQQKETATKAFLDLLKKETPLTSDEYEISSMFSPFYDSLVFAKSLFPGLLDMTKFEEYKSKVYSLMAALVDEGLLSSATYAPRKPVIQSEANYELKRYNTNEVNTSSSYEGMNDYDENREGGAEEDFARQMKEALSGYSPDGGDYAYTGGKYFDRSELENYAVILMPFYNEASVKSFYDKLMKSKNKDMVMNIAILLLKNKQAVNDTVWTYFAKNEKTRLDLYSKLEEAKRLDKFPAQYKSQEEFSRSLLYGYDYDNKDKKERDSIVFISKKLIKNKKGEGYVYFFKRKLADKKEWRLDYVGTQAADEKIVKATARYQRKGLRLYEDKTIDEQIGEIVSELNLRGRNRAGSGYDGGDY